jgi:DNA-binding NarL/FixJ family response regulator
MDSEVRPQEVIKVVICQGRPRLAIGIAKVLESAGIVRVIGRTDNPRQLPRLVAALHPDVVVLDGDRPGVPLAELCDSVRGSRDVGIVLLSVESHCDQLSAAVTAGVDSVVRQPFHPRDLVIAVLQGALRSHSKCSLATLSEFEDSMKANSNLVTGRLQPILGWALGSGEVISPRLR